MIGDGTDGRVYEMLDGNVLKVYQDGITTDEEPNSGVGEQFLKEIAVMSSLECANIPKFMGYRLDKNKKYIATVGKRAIGDLSENTNVFWKDGRLDCRTAIRFIKDISNALRALHQNNIIHCDVKCSNILVYSDRFVLIDYGLSCFNGSTKTVPKKSHYNIITEGYRPPEVLSESSYYTDAVDIWSLGMVIMRSMFRVAMPSSISGMKQFFGRPTTKEFDDFTVHMEEECKQELIKKWSPIKKVLSPSKDAIKAALSGKTSLKVAGGSSSNLKYFVRIKKAIGSRKIGKHKYSKFVEKIAHLVSQMLHYDPFKRISAENLYQEIVKLEEKYNVSSESPQSTSLESKPIKTEEIITERGENIDEIVKLEKYNCEEFSVIANEVFSDAARGLELFNRIEKRCRSYSSSLEQNSFELFLHECAIMSIVSKLTAPYYTYYDDIYKAPLSSKLTNGFLNGRTFKEYLSSKNLSLKSFMRLLADSELNIISLTSGKLI